MSCVFGVKLDISRFFLTLFIFTSWFCLTAFRIASRNLVSSISRTLHVERNIFIVGVGAEAEALGRSLEEYHGHGVRILGFIATPEEPSAPDMIRLERNYTVFPLKDLRPVLARQFIIDEIHFAVESRILSALEPIFRWCDEEGVCSRIAIDFFPKINSYVDLEQIGNTPLLTFSGAPADEALLLVKRAHRHRACIHRHHCC